MEFITLRPLVASERSEGTTAQGLWVINSIDLYVLKSNYYLDAHSNANTQAERGNEKLKFLIC